MHNRWMKLAQTSLQILSVCILKIGTDEFGVSKSGRTKSQKVIVPNAFFKAPVFKEKVDLHLVTALCVISAAGAVLPPAFMTKRATEHPNSDNCGYIPNERRYTTPKAFITHQVFSDYLRSVISLYVTKM
jgi:hypothetical protein